MTEELVGLAAGQREWVCLLGEGAVRIALRLNPQGRVTGLDYTNTSGRDPLITVTLPDGTVYQWHAESEPPPLTQFPPGLAPEDCGIALGSA